MPVMIALGATEATGSSAASMVTTVTAMAGDMLTTMAANPILAVVIGVPVAGLIIGLVGRLLRRKG